MSDFFGKIARKHGLNISGKSWGLTQLVSGGLVRWEKSSNSGGCVAGGLLVMTPEAIVLCISLRSCLYSRFLQFPWWDFYRILDGQRLVPKKSDDGLLIGDSFTGATLVPFNGKNHSQSLFFSHPKLGP